MINLICPICGKQFRRRESYVNNIKNKDNKLTCSINCSRLYHIGDKGSHWKGSTISINCKYCNKSFVGDMGRKYCSPECGHLDTVGKERPKRGKRLKVSCFQCGKEFERLACNFPKRNKHKFCSPDCLHKWMEGKYSGEKNWRWIKDRDSLKKPNDLRKLIDMSNWRVSIFERDEYSCQMCGTTKSPFNAHHIKKLVDYPRLAFDIGNGITLCEGCHKLVTWKEEQYENLFDIILNGMEC